MNKHSKAFEDKKAALQEVEKELREAIDAESEDVELRVIQVLKIAAVVSTAILIGYGIYRWTRQPEEKDVTEEKKAKEPTFIDKIADKVTDVVAGVAVQNISKYIDKLKKDLEKDTKR